MSEETADMLMEIQYKINNIIDILNKGENKWLLIENGQCLIVKLLK
jgi:hypothetical protein